MRIVYIATGSAGMICGSCLRDGALAASLTAKGHDVLFIPIYTPLTNESENAAVDEMFFGAVNVYLQQKSALFRRTPRWLDRWLDRPGLLTFVSRFRGMTAAKDLAGLTISMLEGEDGRQAKELRRMLDWLADQPRPDVVVLPNSLLAGMAEPIRRRLGVPVLCQLAGEDMFLEEFPKPYRERALEALRRRARDCDGFMAPNRYYAEFMAGYLGVDAESIHTAGIGIDCRDFPAGPRVEPEAFTIGFLARICPQKGLHLLAEAFHLLKQDPATADCRLRVAGYLDDPYKPYFRDVLSKLDAWGLRGDVECVGQPDRLEKIEFLRGLSVHVLPAAYPEPKGQSALEAMAAGVPAVVTGVGCLPELIEATGGGISATPGDARSLASALARLMRDKELAKRLGQAGREAVTRRFNVETMADAALSVFKRFGTSA